MIRGIEVTLYEKRKVGQDAFHAPVYEETSVTVPDVLVGEPDAAQIVTELQLNGRHLAYVLGIPKGDDHNWDNAEVEFFGQRFRTYGGVIQGMEAMLPLRWNKKVMVERYE